VRSTVAKNLRSESGNPPLVVFDCPKIYIMNADSVTHVTRLSVWLAMQRAKKREQRDSDEGEESIRRRRERERSGDENIRTTTTAE